RPLGVAGSSFLGRMSCALAVPACHLADSAVPSSRVSYSWARAESMGDARPSAGRLHGLNSGMATFGAHEATWSSVSLRRGLRPLDASADRARLRLHREAGSWLPSPTLHLQLRNTERSSP